MPNEAIEGKTQDTFSIYKADDDKRLVFGWASISIKVDGEQLEDRQEDIIDPDDLEEAAYEYVLNFRDTGEEHIKSMRKKGKLVESCVFTAEKQKAMGLPERILPIGWWIGFKIEDDDAWERVKNGTYKMFSIEGKANRIPVEKSGEKPVERVAKTFSDILKFNPFHDALGRFASSNSFATYSANPKSKAGAMAISRSAQGGHGTTFNVHRESQGENISQNYAWLNGGPGAKQLSAQGQLPGQQPKQPPKPTKTYDSHGFADYDDAAHHQLYNRKQYFQQQQLTPAQKKACDSYVDPAPERGSLYNAAQNMNWAMVNGQQLTGTHKQMHDDMMSAMHNIGYNVNLTRYDHAGMIDSVLRGVGAGSDYTKMSLSQLQKSLVGQSIGETKFISTTTNNFQTAPASAQRLFTDRAVKINYKANANVKGLLMPIGKGGDQGELVLAPTNGSANSAPRITAVRMTGRTVYRTKTGRAYPQIEIDLEWD